LTQPPTTVLRTRGHRLSVTSAVASESCKHLFTSGKEGSIIKWDLVTGKKLAVFYKLRLEKKGKGKGKQKAWSGDVSGHTDEVLALALSGDGKHLASGGKDRKVGIWDVEKEEWVKGFGGHKDTISVSDEPGLSNYCVHCG
jgi:ribosomal RNA-processing protein 9